eukprot:1160014-Pelagomonas_calceolata.AAC.6
MIVQQNQPSKVLSFFLPPAVETLVHLCIGFSDGRAEASAKAGLHANSSTCLAECDMWNMKPMQRKQQQAKQHPKGRKYMSSSRSFRKHLYDEIGQGPAATARPCRTRLVEQVGP